MSLKSAFELLQQRTEEAEGRRKADNQGMESKSGGKVVQLPLWPESVRGVPNSVLRSALFGVVRRGRRAYQERAEKAAPQGIRVLHTGPTLDQGDLDVWEQCLHLAREQALGDRVEFTAHSFLKAIGRGTGRSQHEWLKKALVRLAASVVEIEDGPRGYWGPLIHGGARDEDSGRYVVEINPQIRAIYGDGGWTQLELEQRQALAKKPLSQWLHGYYSSHARPFPVKVATLHRLCGSETKQLKHFRAELRSALERVEAATGWQWRIDRADLVHVEKQPTPAQARHLMKKRARHSTHGGTA